ncbi:MAG: cobyrinate a,c-diamide synthase [Rhodospirillales bacterium]
MADDRRRSVPKGVIVAAPASGSGKTTVTLGLLRALSARGRTVRPFKVGPDYIDPGFHTRAAGTVCANLDPWAMRSGLIGALIGRSGSDEIVVCEGVMGLFDGATAHAGSTADVAALTGWPVILVVDAARQAGSAAALVRGFANHRPGVRVAGVIFNRVGSDRHRRHVGDAMADLADVPVLGYLPPAPGLSVPSRHLGLVQAMEIDDVETMIGAAATLVEKHVDVTALLSRASSTDALDADGGSPSAPVPPPLDPLGQRIALADDRAFAFRYGHVLDGWRTAGADILPFSPLAGDGLPAGADAVYLPGGYPELHAGAIAANAAFLGGLRQAADDGVPIVGECGGYMVLGQGLVDADGARHAMAGLLPVETSFAERKLHLGYRRAELLADCPLGAAGTMFRAHEFHYASVVSEDGEGRMFESTDAFGDPQPAAGHIRGSVCGSFVHLIDREDG